MLQIPMRAITTPALIALCLFVGTAHGVKCPRTGQQCPRQCCYDAGDNEFCCDQGAYYYSDGAPVLVGRFDWTWLVIGLAVSLVLSVALSALCCLLCNCAARRPLTFIRGTGTGGSESDDSAGAHQYGLFAGAGIPSATIYIHGAHGPPPAGYYGPPPPTYDGYSAPHKAAAPYASSMDARQYQEQRASTSGGGGRYGQRRAVVDAPPPVPPDNLLHVSTGGRQAAAGAHLSAGDYGGTWPKNHSPRAPSSGRVSPASSVKSVRFADDDDDEAAARGYASQDNLNGGGSKRTAGILKPSSPTGYYEAAAGVTY